MAPWLRPLYKEYGVAAGFVVATTAGGLADQVGGGKFLNGAITASYIHMYNHLGSRKRNRMKSLKKINPNGFEISNNQVEDNTIKLYDGIKKELGHSNFEFEVTGGDRYANISNHTGKAVALSATNLSHISASSPNSPHFDVNGSRAIDIRIKNVSSSMVDLAVKKYTSFLPSNTIRGYKDGHTHFSLPNKRGFYAN